MSKPTALFLVALLLFFSLCSAGRPMPTLDGDETPKAQDVKEEKGFPAAEESCQGISEDECLMRRSLQDAHLDYIYTQSHKP